MDGWGGSGPLPGIPLFVVTHEVPGDVPAGDPPYRFVLDGVESAIDQAREAADGKEINLMGSTVVRQALQAGLLDEVVLHVVPVLLGAGTRLFDDFATALECVEVVAAPGVTHIRYLVGR